MHDCTDAGTCGLQLARDQAITFSLSQTFTMKNFCQNWENEGDNFETTLRVFRSQAATEKFKFLNTVSQHGILMAQTNGFSLMNEEEHATSVSKCHVTL